MQHTAIILFLAPTDTLKSLTSRQEAYEPILPQMYFFAGEMRMMNFAKIGTLCIIVMAATSCRNPIQSSRLNTLDNVGSDVMTFEACQGMGQIHPKAFIDNEPHLKLALAAVPYKIQKGFFEDLGGRIRITQSDECGSSALRQDDALGCWRRLPDQDQSIEVVIRRSTNAKEQYTLVRTFGFIYGDILLSRIVPKDISAPVQVASRPGGNLANYKTHLAAVFLGELYSSVDGNSRSALTKTLADLGVSSAVLSEKDFEQRLQKFSRLPTNIQDTFASRIFAETFHSQFCLRETAERACKKFPATMRSFKPYADDVANSGENRLLGCAPAETTRASATHLEWHSLNQHRISLRDARGADKGAYAGAKIAQAVAQRSNPSTSDTFSLSSNQSELSLNADIFQQLLGLVTGGLSGGGGSSGGLGGILGQIFGGLGGDGGGGIGGLGDLGGLLGGLGLEGLLNKGGDLGDNDTPDITPQPSVIPSNNTPLPTGGQATAEEQAGIDATNRYRQSKGKSVLQIDQQMIVDCRKQSQMQAQSGGLTHWLHPAGVARAENIAYGSKSGEYTVMEQWVKSPGHHANIMGNHRFIGIGSFGNQWCQRFR